MTVPTAIQFQQDHIWDSVSAKCRQLNRETLDRVYEIIDTDRLCPNNDEWLGQMASVFVNVSDPSALKERLMNKYQIEIPVFEWDNKIILRFSFNAYNDEQDADKLIHAISDVF